MKQLGDFFFRWRNALFPVFYLLMFLPGPRLLPDWRVAVAIGVAVTALGQGVRMLTIGYDYIVRGGRGKRVYADGLVTGGLFAHSRNPMYVGNVTMLLGMGVVSNNALYVAFVVPFFFFVYACIISAEEHFLRNKFGAEFEAYRARVPRWLPRLSGLTETLAGAAWDWRKVLIKEYGTTALWLLATILLVGTHVLRNSGWAGVEAHAAGFATALVALAVAYLTIRYLKKSGTVRAGAQA